MTSFDIDNSLHSFVLKHFNPVKGVRRAKTTPPGGQFYELKDTGYSIITDIMQQCWDGQEMTDNDRKNAKEAFCDAKGRTACLAWLNKKRANGAYEFRGLNPTGEVLNILLDEAHSAWDIVNSCLCIVLSQTFHDSSHTFLQSKIAQHRIWQDTAFWDAAFALKVQTDMDQFNEYCCLDVDMEIERQEKLRSVLFAHMTTFMTIMKSFDIEGPSISLFVSQQSKKWHLSSFEKEVMITAHSNVA